uniref:Uncharacterized protein n=1 Tax=Setaria viridis TaxID=4556 RepID=A0A4U6VKI9_SETVI|nr:putative F-box/LRR-repeat protein At3g28410 [Setaria viridis]TKW30138.1 hypothetical protein SEVIR_2G015300v2 [Setaria viridis]
MGTIAGDEWTRRLEDEEDEELVDRISGLPDAVLGDIVTLLPTRDGARTQVLSSRWRHVWRSAPLNFDSNADSPRTIRGNVRDSEISRALSAHQGPGRRFRHEFPYVDTGTRSAAKLDCWLRYPALDNLQELVFHYGIRFPRGWSSLPPPPPLPESVRRFSPTLRVASFGGCAFPEVNAASAPLHLPVLKQLSLTHATISEKSLLALLAGCPVLQSLLLSYNSGCSRVRIASRTLTSIGVNPGRGDSRLQHLILEDAPCLERLLVFSSGTRKIMDISVISAPKLDILGPLSDDFSRVEFGSTVFQGSLVSIVTVVPSVKILALVNGHPSMDVVIGFLQCFPCLEKLYIKTKFAGYYENGWRDEYHNLVSTLDIRVKKVVLLNYRGDKSHVNFAKLFVLNARVLESMVLELVEGIVPSTEWIERQHKRLHTKNKASTSAQFDFVGHDVRSGLFGNVNEAPAHVGYVNEAQAHDLSTADPFVRFRDWPC